MRINSTCLKMTARLVCGALLLLLAGCGGPREGFVVTARGPIRGTFIQYQDWMMRLDRGDWRRELDAMRRAGIDLVIVQWLENESSSFLPRHGWSHDPTETILSYADDHGMRVFIGLAHADIWRPRLRDSRYLDRSAARSNEVADEAWRRYGNHRSFAGWYLPQEIRDAVYSPDQISDLRAFFKRLGDHCRTLSGGKPVAVAPAIMGLIHVDAFTRAYTSLLSGSGINIVILQDGVGARGWNEGLEARVVPYFLAMRDACRASGAEMWSDIEIFEKGESSSGRIPTSIERIRRQFDAESSYVATFVMFDFFHYMSPYRGEAQKKLYEDYVRAFVKPGGAPPGSPPPAAPDDSPPAAGPRRS
jgi:hypothetical protein